MKRDKPKRIPHFWTGDFETDPAENGVIPETFAHCLYCPDKPPLVTVSEQGCSLLVWEQLNTLPAGSRVYYHNGGKFDFNFFRPYLTDANEITVINHKIATIKLENGTELRDSLLLLPVALKKLGTGKKEISIDKFHRSLRHIYMDEICDYMIADCVSLHVALHMFFQTFSDSLTLASASFGQLKSYSEKIHRLSEKTDKLVRPYYHGGRTEAFRKGSFDCPVYYYDISSAYPHAMTTPHSVSNTFVHVGSQRDVKKVKVIPQSFYTIRCIPIGTLPLVSDDDSLSYPVGGEALTFKVTGHELQMHKSVGGTGTIIEEVRPTHAASFTQFVEHFYKMKNDSKGTAMELFYKLILNSAYGKLGTNPDHYRDYLIVTTARADETISELGFEWSKSGELNDCFTLIEKPSYGSGHTGKMPLHNVSTAASITGYVRSRIAQMVAKYSDAILYCDTDSLMLTRPMDESDIGKGLGKWEYKDTFIETHICGKKLYCARTKEGREYTACKGVRLSFDEIKKVATGKVATFNADFASWPIAGDPRWISRDVKMT